MREGGRRDPLRPLPPPHEAPHGCCMKKIDLTGMTFGRLTAVKRIAAPYENTRYLCRCECGSEPTVLQTHLQRGNTKSCGCQQGSANAARNKAAAKHGMWRTNEFAIWTSMLARCSEVAEPEKRSRYFDRGIRVCQRWADSFAFFYADMGPRPSKKHSLDRIDNDGNYEPGNVRWATAVEQCTNKSNNVRYEVRGEWLTAREIGDKYGLTKSCVQYRGKRGRRGEELIVAPMTAGRPR